MILFIANCLSAPVARVVLDLETTNLTITEGDNDGTKMCASVVEVDPPRECPIQFDVWIAFLTAELDPTSAGMFHCVYGCTPTNLLYYYFRTTRRLWSHLKNDPY